LPRFENVMVLVKRQALARLEVLAKSARVAMAYQEAGPSSAGCVTVLAS